MAQRYLISLWRRRHRRSWQIRGLWIKGDGGQHAPDGTHPYIARRFDRQPVTFTHPAPALKIHQKAHNNQSGTLRFRQH